MTDIDENEHGYFIEWAEPDEPAAPIAAQGVNLDGELEKCNWHLRKIAGARRERDALAAVYKAEFDRLALRWSTRATRLDAVIAWHEAPLKSYMAMRRETDGTKSIELPHGTIRSRTATKPTVTVDDQAAVIAWAGDVLPDVVVVKHTVDRRALAAYVAASGEVPPGVTVTPPTTTYTITTEETS